MYIYRNHRDTDGEWKPRNILAEWLPGTVRHNGRWDLLKTSFFEYTDSLCENCLIYKSAHDSSLCPCLKTVWG